MIWPKGERKSDCKSHCKKEKKEIREVHTA